MKALILDDESKGRDLLKEMLNTFCPDFQITSSVESVDSAIESIQHNPPNAVFLDVEMPGQNGLQLLSYFDVLPFEVIFVTGYKKYALTAFQFGACDYLLKPLNPERLIKAVKRLRKKIKSKENPPVEHHYYKKLSLPTLNGYNVVEIEQIEYCLSEGNYTSLYFKDGESLLVSKNLKKFEDLLKRYKFMRIHRSSLINTECISGYLKGKIPRVILESGKVLEVSPQKKEALISLLNIL